MKYLKEFANFDKGKKISSNVIQFDMDKIDDNIISQFKSKYPTKWIIPSTSYGSYYIFIKDKPVPYREHLPDKIYHVSNENNLEKIGITPSTKSESPFGYYNLSFFYLNEEEARYGSIPYIEGENYLYEIDTNATKNWLNAINKPLDGEDNITTSEVIQPKYIKLI